MMHSLTLALAVLPLLGAAYLVDPDTPAASDTIEDCTYWAVAAENDTCASISANWGITLEQFNTYVRLHTCIQPKCLEIDTNISQNPSQAPTCNLTIGNSYCIEQNWGVPPATVTPTPTPTSTVTPTPTPTPTDALGVCEQEASGYKRYCPRCLYRCENETTYMSECFYSVFSSISYNDSQCWQHGGNDCANKAADIVCPGQ